ncbi:Uncharacterised protein [Segatella copri]|nr:Uncharacterised protein [Segatella copri]
MWYVTYNLSLAAWIDVAERVFSVTPAAENKSSFGLMLKLSVVAVNS